MHHLAAEGLASEIAIEDIEDLGAVFEVVAVANALIADAIADDEKVGPVNGDPAIVAIPDRGAEDIAAAHRVADEVIVNGISAQDVFLAEMAKLRVADRSFRITVIHGVPAHAMGIGRFDDDIAAQIADDA